MCNFSIYITGTELILLPQQQTPECILAPVWNSLRIDNVKLLFGSIWWSLLGT